MKVQQKTWLNARTNDLPDSQHFGIHLAWVKAGQLNWETTLRLHAYENVSSSSIRKSRHTAKKLNPLFIITLVENLCLVFNVQAFADLIVYECLQVSGSDRFQRLVQQGHGLI